MRVCGGQVRKWSKSLFGGLISAYVYNVVHEFQDSAVPQCDTYLRAYGAAKVTPAANGLHDLTSPDSDASLGG